MPEKDPLQAAISFLKLEQQERRHLSQRLHDDLQQMLAASKMILQKYSVSRAEADLKEAIDILDQTLLQTRYMTVELSPPLLFKSGIRSNFEWLIPWMLDRHRTKVSIIFHEEDRPVTEEMGHFLLWSVKQVLIYGSRSDTRQAQIEVTFKKEGLEILISQDSPSILPMPLELLEVQQRVHMLGGTFEYGGTNSLLTIIIPAAALNYSPTA